MGVCGMLTGGDIGFPFSLKFKKGQAVVELVLILPILLLLIVGAIEYGRLISSKIVITNASREGAYYFSMNSTTNDGSTVNITGAQTAASNETVSSGLSLSTSVNCCDASNNCGTSLTYCKVGNNVIVTSQATVQNVYLITLIGKILGIKGQNNSISLSNSSTMVIQK